MSAPAQPTRRRGRVETLTKAAFFSAAIPLLAEQGFRALSIAALCTRAGVTSGSFYHHFEGLGDFREQLLEHWAQAQEYDLERRAGDDPGDPLRRLAGVAAELPHAAEAAFRAWGLNDPAAAQVQAQVDATRHANLALALRIAGLGSRRAGELADTGMAMLAGMQVLHRPLSRSRMRPVLEDFVQGCLREAARVPAASEAG